MGGMGTLPYNNMTSFSVGLVVSVLGLGMLLCSPADAQHRNRQQRAYGGQSYSGGITVMPRNTPRSNVVCWTPCDQPGAIVMGAFLVIVGTAIPRAWPRIRAARRTVPDEAPAAAVAPPAAVSSSPPDESGESLGAHEAP